MVTITNDKAATKIEQALICAAKYRVLALSDSNPLMIRLFEEMLFGSKARRRA